MDALTILTPTGGRQECFSLLEKLVAAQNYTGEVQWIVADDCIPETNCTLGQTVVRPRPEWSPGQVTCARNYLAMLPLIRHSKILFIEDDDYIGPDYFKVMSSRLDQYSLVGECDSHYYNVAVRKYRLWNNRAHSSLAQMGIRPEILPHFESLCERPPGSLDIFLCRKISTGKFFYPWSGIYVGIKGMPGRPGVVTAHRKTFGQFWMADPNLTELRRWIGDGADLYTKYGANGAN